MTDFAWEVILFDEHYIQNYIVAYVRLYMVICPTD